MWLLDNLPTYCVHKTSWTTDDAEICLTMYGPNILGQLVNRTQHHIEKEKDHQHKGPHGAVDGQFCFLPTSLTFWQWPLLSLEYKHIRQSSQLKVHLVLYYCSPRLVVTIPGGDATDPANSATKDIIDKVTVTKITKRLMWHAYTEGSKQQASTRSRSSGQSMQE